jgi:hypothetical protein
MKEIVMILLLSGTAATNPALLESRAERVGVALCAAAVKGMPLKAPGPLAVQDLDGVGPDLTQRLRDLAPQLAPGCTARPIRADSPLSRGDGRGTHHLMVRVKDRDVFGLRLRYEPGEDRFHILGYWTPGPI